ncbi:tetratricopeptide repeat protein, partial [Limnoraphis robusta]|uniref:ATP-binding protein n=1 Tax=Limnoraphis robusta TaxID=1118279 RepID=UPI0019103B06
STFEKLLQLEPNNARTLASYANVLSQNGEYRKAISTYEKALELEPNDVISLTNYADILRKIGETEKAITTLEKALELEPDDVRTLNSYANVLSQNGEYRKAISTLEKALQLAPDNFRTLTRYANILSRTGKHEQALQYYEQALQIEPNNTKILVYYGKALLKTKNYEKACTVLERSTALYPDNYALFIYARSLENLERYSEAISQLQQINIDELQPYHANVIRITLGRLHYAIQERPQGDQYFEEAINNSSDKEKTLLYSARSILANDPYSERATKMLQEFTEDSPRYAQAYEMLTLNLSEQDYFEMFATDSKSSLSDTEMLNRAMYHKIANEVNILKSIAYRILRVSDGEYPLLNQIVQEIDRILDEIQIRREQQQAEIQSIPADNYSAIIHIVSKTAHDISDFVNNQLAILESKTRRAIRKIDKNDSQYSKFEKLLEQLEYTQNALNDLKAINEGITIRKSRFQVKELFKKWAETSKLDNASIYLDIQNSESEFNSDEEKIKSALNELVENSIKHNVEKENLEIYIKSEDAINPPGIRGMTIPGQQKYLHIQFYDNGKGVPDDRKDWIFQPLQTTSKEGKGSGLGLFIIRKTLAKMQGHISETGESGARFEIYIPYT